MKTTKDNAHVKQSRRNRRPYGGRWLSVLALCGIGLTTMAALGVEKPSNLDEVDILSKRASSRGGTYYGIHVGINEYNSYMSQTCAPLKGCVNDANGIYEAYTDAETGFCAKENACKFLDSAATKSAIRAKLKSLSNVAKAGDVVFYSHSSHAGSRKDAHGNYTTDVSICTYDNNYSDVEFAEDLALFASGVQIVVVLDTCHSEGMFRAKDDEDVEWDFAARVESILANYRIRGADATFGSARGGANIGWISAAKYNEYSADGQVNGKFWGIYTYALLEGWITGLSDKNGDGNMDFWELYEYSRDNCSSSHAQYLNRDVLESVFAARTTTGVVSPKKPDLEFMTYGGWPSSVFLSASSDSLTETMSFEEGAPIFLFTYFKNMGSAVAEQFTILLELYNSSNNRLIAQDNSFKTPLVVGQGGGYNGKNVNLLQGLAAGNYYLMITLDSEKVVDESNEDNNVARIPFAVTKKSVPSPSAPGSLTVSPSGNNLMVSWNAVSGAASYKVYRAETASKPSSAHKTVSEATSYLDQGVEIGKTYYYWVSAVNSVGQEGAASGPKAGKVGVDLSLADPSTCTFDYNGGQGSVVVSANASWSASADKSWVHITSATSGGSGKTKLTFSVDAYDAIDNRSATITVTATGGTAQKSLSISQTGKAANPALAAALDNPGLSFRTGGDSDWIEVVTEDVFSTSGDYARSGTLAAGQTSWIETKVMGAGTLQFRYSLSTLYGGAFSLFVDGAEVTSISAGLGQWKYYSCNISSSGSHIIRWEYSASFGSSYAMLDDISFGAGNRPRLPDSFSATSDASGVSLFWQTVLSSVTKCKIYRSTALSSTNPDLIQTVTPSGNSYSCSFTEQDTTGTLGATYYYWVEAENSYGSTICGGVTGQKESGAVNLEKTELNLPAIVNPSQNGEFKVACSPNMAFYAKSGVDWITFKSSPQSYFASAVKITFTVGANTDAQPRHGVVYFFSDKACNNLLETLAITQDGMPRNPTPLTWYVDATNGDDANEGSTWETAKKSIQAAIDSALSGDEIVVGDGTYQGFEVNKLDLRIRSLNGAYRTIVDGAGLRDVVVDAYDTSSAFTGFTVQNNSYNFSAGGCVRRGSWHRSIIRNGSARKGGGAFSAKLYNCLVYDNIADDGAGGTVGCDLYNCIVTRNGSSTGVGGVAIGSEGVAYNCIIWGNTNKLGEASNWSGNKYGYCCTLPLPDAGVGNISSDPLLTVADGVCSLDAASPCLNAGNNDYAVGEVDFVGNPRIGNGVVDIGAVEDITVAPDSPTASVLEAQTGAIKIDIQPTGRAVEYVVYRSTSAAPRPNQAHATVQATPNAATVFADTADVLPGVEYWYWIVAQNEAGPSVAFFAGKGYQKPNLKLNPNTVSQFAYGGGYAEFGITANSDWAAISSKEWLSVTPSAGNGNGMIAVTASSNTTTASRDAVLSVVAGFGTAHPVTNMVSIAQEAALPPVYHVTFDKNGGQGAMDALDFPDDAEKALPACGFARTGYAFAGWSLEPNGEVFYLDCQVVTLQKDTTLYAVWRANEYSVVFLANFGDVERPQFQKFTYDVSQKLLANPYVREDATFLGWSFSPSGSVVYGDGEEVLNISSEKDAQVYLYAIWKQVAVPPDWVQAEGVAANSMTVYAKVFDAVRNAFIDAEGSMLGAFDADGVCRGAETILTEKSLFQLTVGVKSETESGLILKVWDADSGEVYEIAERISYDPSQVVGSFKAPRVFTVGRAETTINLTTGWNWISSCLVLEDARVGAVFGACTFADGDIVKSSSKTATYDGDDGVWYPSDFAINPGVTYCVRKSAGDNERLVLQGMPMKDGLTVHSGWNWVSSTSTESVSIADVTHSRGFAEDDMAKSSSKTATYSDGQWWFSKTFDFTPGVGYKLYLTNPGELSFSAQRSSQPAQSNTSRGIRAAAGLAVKDSAPDWNKDEDTQLNNFTFYMRVEKPDGSGFFGEGCIVAAFSKTGKCRGTEEGYDYKGRWTFPLTINNASSPETGFTFKVWDAENLEIYEVEGDFTYNGEDAIGTLKEPIVLKAKANEPPVTTVTVSFKPNGGSGTMASQTVTKNVATVLNKCAFTKSGCSFKEWSGSDGKTYQDRQSVTLSSDLVLTAQWTAGLASIAINGPATVESAGTATYTCTATYSDKSTATVPAEWSLSAGGAYGSIDPSTGVFIALSAPAKRTVTVKTSFGGKSATKTVTIAARTLASIAISGPDKITSLASEPYSCTAIYSDGTSEKVSATWTLLTGVACASVVTTTGVVTSKNDGEANQLATLRATFGGKTADKAITLLAKELPEPPGPPAIRYVDAINGGDLNDGLSWGTAMKSIQSAVDASGEGDLILVAEGTYAPILVIEKTVEIRAADGEEVVIDGGGASCCAVLGGSGKLSGLVLRNGFADFGGGAQGGALENCVIEDCKANFAGGGAYHCELSRCIVTRCSARIGGGLSWGYAENTVIYNCRADDGDGSRYSHGGGAEDSTLVGCTVYGCSAASGAGVAGCTVQNSIVWENRLYETDKKGVRKLGNCANVTEGKKTLIKNTCTYTDSSPKPAGTGNLAKDPLFVDADSGDFRLQWASPVKNKGKAALSLGDFDLGGLPRLVGAPDLGAHEIPDGTPVPADYDGDGVTDAAHFDAPTATWIIRQSRDGLLNVRFGEAKATPVPADYDGDGKADFATYSATAKVPAFRILTQAGDESAYVLGEKGATPLAADIDGDGRADPCVFQGNAKKPSFTALLSGNGHDAATAFLLAFGTKGAKPVAGDFDGDGRADFGFYTATASKPVFNVALSGRGWNAASPLAVALGAKGSEPCCGDFDGDGTTDFAVYNGAAKTPLLYRMFSTSKWREVRTLPFGAKGSRAVMADWDGDGAADAALEFQGGWWRVTRDWDVQEIPAP